MNCVGAGQIEPIRGQPADSRASKNNAQQATGETDKHALGNLRTDEAHTAASQRRAHCHLLAARYSPSNEQIRKVQAGDEQKTEDGHHQNVERGFGVSYDIVDKRKRNDCGCYPAVTAEAGKDSVLNCTYFLGRAAQRDAGSEARDHLARMAVMAMQDSRGNSFVIGNPQLDLRIGIREPLREHAHDRIWLSIEANGLSDDRGISIEAAFEGAPR